MLHELLTMYMYTSHSHHVRRLDLLNELVNMGMIRPYSKKHDISYSSSSHDDTMRTLIDEVVHHLRLE